MKKVLIVVFVILLLIPVFLVMFYLWGNGALSREEKTVNFTIEAGTTKTQIAKNLENAGLIRSEYALDLYMIIHSPNIQAGEYVLSPSMKPEEMITKFSNGDVKIQSQSVTLVEGMRLIDYAETLSDKYNFSKKEFLDQASDIDFLKTLIDSGNYWFLSDVILDPSIYYPLEGYLFPDTYEFLETVKPDEVITTILNHTLKKLENFKDKVLASDKTIHEYLTMASIVEKEANSLEDRQKASQVFYLRMTSGMSLGSDVTAYYGVKKNMTEVLTINELEDNNPYNTRLTSGEMNGKLPVGPIANPSLSSIEAAISPANTSYLYFVANVCTGEVFFQENYQDFIVKVRELQAICASN